MHTTFCALVAAATLASTAATQVVCPSDNTYPIAFVDRDGNPALSTFPNPDSGVPIDVFGPTKEIYMALPPDMPAGRYYVQVTDTEIQEILNEAFLVDRVYLVSVNPVTGERTITAESPNSPPLGVGPGGVGQSIPMFPLRAPDTGLINPKTGRSPLECTFKAWIGDCYDPFALANPDLFPFGTRNGILGGEVNGTCCLRSFREFQVGDLTGSTVSGKVFLDDNENGVRDPGEDGVEGCIVELDDGTSVSATTTDADGCYSFSGVVKGDYTVTLVFPPNTAFVATTATSHQVTVCGCEAVEVPDFGKSLDDKTCAARTPGFWQNKHGRRLIEDNGLLPGLVGLPLADQAGNCFDPASVRDFAAWLKRRNAENMAYQLSGHLAAMYLNIEVGFVDSSCSVTDPVLGVVGISDLVQMAVDALNADKFTPSGDPNRAAQEAIKNALDDANNNRTWN